VSLLAVFQAIENNAIGAAIRNSTWLFPVVESIHLLGLALLGGAVLMVDMRLLGLGLRAQPISQLSRDARPWLILGLLVSLPTGFLLFMSEAVKCYYHGAFWAKMIFLALALLFTFTIKRRVALAEAPMGWVASRLIALVSITLWTGVGLGGRWIGFS
jgi:hypothetical protein